MAYEPKEGSTTLFLNDKWQGTHQPAWKGGKMLVNGVVKEAAIWVGKDFKEEDFRFLPQRLSLKVADPFAPRAEAAPARREPVATKQPALAQELDDDIPF
jgi:hypothetical protein